MLKLFLALILSLSIGQLSAQTDTTAHVEPPFNPELESAFPGGAQAWAKFLQQNLDYPAKAVRKKIQGEVILEFIVERDGTLSNIAAISGPELLRKAAIDALKRSPKWIPAHQGGRTVRSYRKQPINFRLPG